MNAIAAAKQQERVWTLLRRARVMIEDAREIEGVIESGDESLMNDPLGRNLERVLEDLELILA